MSPTDDTRTSDEPLRSDTPSVDPPELRLAAPLQTRDPDRYEILGEHGRGGLGRVFRARDKELGRDIAVKELLERGNATEVRFLREALITARLEHPGIVPVHEAGRWPDGTPFYAMKLVSGSPLKTLVERATTPEQRLALVPNVIAVADAIAYAHDRRIIHRDLKPSNVIVGDFGETVVIDWGLAKSLDEQPTAIDSPYRGPQGHELTASGSVLGTPAYMAPEQYAGHADERTDIYAIGGILFHLLSGRPPHRDGATPRYTAPMALARVVPKDLAAIVERAMKVEPSQRYASARALAEELRRFTQHLPVTARRYSLVARLARVVVRHRTAASIGAVALVMILATLVLALIKINGERKHAIEARGDLTLQHAELLLQSDPTAAAMALDSYQGPDENRRRLLASLAYGRGVAVRTLSPNADTIRFLRGARDGSILSIGEDRQVRLTSEAGTSTLANDVDANVLVAESRDRHVAAYSKGAAGVAILDVATRRFRSVDAPNSTTLALSSDGTELATLDTTSHVTMWQLSVPPRVVRTVSVSDLQSMGYVNAHDLVISDHGQTRVLSGTSPTISVEFDAVALGSSPDHIALGNRNGVVAVFHMPDVSRVATATVCRGGVNDLVRIAQSNQFAFVCEGGETGVVDYATGEVSERFAVTAPGFLITASDSGRYLAVVASDSSVSIHDLVSHITHRYRGHANRLSVISLPTTEYPYILSGDVNGAVRVWPMPSESSRVVMQADESIFNVVFSPDGKLIATDGADGTVRLLSIETGAVSRLIGHEGPVVGLEFSPRGDALASAGFDGTARVWSVPGGTLIKVVRDHHTRVEHVTFTSGGQRVVSSGDDGRVLEWPVSGVELTVLLKRPRPILLAWELKSEPPRFLVTDADGGLWTVDKRNEPSRSVVAPTIDHLTSVRTSPRGDLVATGNAGGTIVIYATQTWTAIKTADVGGAIRRISFSPDGSEIAAASENGSVHRIRVRDETPPSWNDLSLASRDICYSPDGSLLGGALVSGGVWVYSIPRGVWAFTTATNVDTKLARFSPDSRFVVTVDAKGTVVLHDVQALIGSLATQETR